MNTTSSPCARVAIFAVVVSLTACAGGPQGAIFESAGAVESRSIQSRVVETGDPEATLRAVIATLQDLGFVVDRADAALGSVSATKLDRYQVRMTVTVRPRNTDQVLVRANADYSEPMKARTAVLIEDPTAYQDFFQALDRSVFLAREQVE